MCSKSAFVKYEWYLRAPASDWQSEDSCSSLKSKPFSDRKSSMFITEKLNQHVTSVHDENKQFKWEVCDHRPSRNFTLDQQVKSVHEENKQFKCKV